MDDLAVGADPAGVDVQRARAVREYVGGDGPGERLAGEHDRLVRGLERGAPALPLLGVGRGGRGDIPATRIVAVSRLAVGELRRAPILSVSYDLALRARRLVDRLAHVQRLR